jgi:phosphohistidine phosphatase
MWSESKNAANQGTISAMADTRTLYVLRHAKSSWDDSGQPDHERPLAPRGWRATELLAAYIAEQGIKPDLVLCSTARRARETLEGVGVEGGQTMLSPTLYSASADELIVRLAASPEAMQSVMIVGHNPALQMLILRLAKSDYHMAPGPLDDLRRKFPSGALASLTFEGDWSNLVPGCADLTGYVRPKDLPFK